MEHFTTGKSRPQARGISSEMEHFTARKSRPQGNRDRNGLSIFVMLNLFQHPWSGGAFELFRERGAEGAEFAESYPPSRLREGVRGWVFSYWIPACAGMTEGTIVLRRMQEVPYLCPCESRRCLTCAPAKAGAYRGKAGCFATRPLLSQGHEGNTPCLRRGTKGTPPAYAGAQSPHQGRMENITQLLSSSRSIGGRSVTCSVPGGGGGGGGGGGAARTAGSPDSSSAI